MSLLYMSVLEQSLAIALDDMSSPIKFFLCFNCIINQNDGSNEYDIPRHLYPSHISLQNITVIK